MTSHGIEEPLLESAPLAWRLAPQLCHRDPATGEDCSWYHSIWQILRLMGLASSATHRSEFYHRAIPASAAGTDIPRILISGTADYAMLAQVIASLRGRNIRPAITVVDICETPLHLNRWYAGRVSHQIETERSDIFSYTASGPFDLICTDSILSRFTAAQWPALAAKWHGLLRPGGAVVTSSRLRPGEGPGKIGFPADQVKAFQDAVLRAAQKKLGPPGIEPEELARCAGLYASRQFNHPVQSTDQIRTLFETAGFAFDELSVAPRASGNSEGINAPTVPGRAEFVRVIARRR